MPRDRTPVAVKVDNLIRRRLRIGDPTDPQDVADGLRKLFAGDARALDLEAKGLPLLPPTRDAAAARPAEAARPAPSWTRRTDDVERDLEALTTNSQLKDIEPELQGWGQAIRGIVADGIGRGAARSRPAAARPRLRAPAGSSATTRGSPGSSAR